MARLIAVERGHQGPGPPQVRLGRTGDGRGGLSGLVDSAQHPADQAVLSLDELRQAGRVPEPPGQRLETPAIQGVGRDVQLTGGPAGRRLLMCEISSSRSAQ